MESIEQLKNLEALTQYLFEGIKAKSLKISVEKESTDSLVSMSVLTCGQSSRNLKPDEPLKNK